MDSFHHGSQLAFDSYIRRYKINHLQMCFDGIEYRDRGLFVACAVPASPSPLKEEEQIVGFCCVDGRAPDPSCKLEFLTPSTLAGTSPRPYLSDLGVCVVHRRRGIGEKLVHACEEWTNKRGYEKLYLKVENNNAGGLGLYSALGYKETKLPWGRNASVDARWDTTVLLEKPLTDSMQNERRKRSWIKNQVWKPLKNSVERYSGRVNDGPPLWIYWSARFLKGAEKEKCVVFVYPCTLSIGIARKSTLVDGVERALAHPKHWFGTCLCMAWSSFPQYRRCRAGTRCSMATIWYPPVHGVELYLSLDDVERVLFVHGNDLYSPRAHIPLRIRIHARRWCRVSTRLGVLL